MVTARRGSGGPSPPWCAGAASELGDQGAAALGVVEEWGMTAGDDLEAGVG
jgi:hypothetical protein